MQKSIGAVYENGLLRTLEPLHLAERQVVSLTIDESAVALADDYEKNEPGGLILLLGSLFCE